MKTPLCDQLGIDHPVILAPAGPAACPAVAAAVSNAGALGTLALAGYDSESARRLIQETRSLTSKPFCVNFILTFPYDDMLDVCLEEQIPAISFFWGDVAPLVDRVHDAGSLVLLQIGSVEEARKAADCGVDIIVAQGWEAGGHVRGEIATLPLVPSVVDAVAPVPVVAAGGIADGRGLAAVIALGAAGAWIGTRFLMSNEAPLHAEYVDRLIGGSSADTVHTDLFDWPNAEHRDAPHRVLRNSTLTEWELAGQPPPGQRPAEGQVLARDAQGQSVLRYESYSARDDHEGDIEAFPLWAGQGVGLVTRRQPAAEIVREIVDGAERVIRKAAASL